MSILDKLSKIEALIQSATLSGEKQAALCHKQGLSVYRYYRQRYTTTCIRIRQDVMDNVLWPEYMRYAKILEELVEDVMRDLISKIHNGPEEETVIAGEIAN